MSGEEAVGKSVELQPDLVLMDLAMPGIGGLDATRKIKSGINPPRVIIITIHEGDEYRKSAEEAGADGFISKSELHIKLAKQIRSFFPHFFIDGSKATETTRAQYNPGPKV